MAGPSARMHKCGAVRGYFAQNFYNDKHEDKTVIMYRDTVYTPTVELAELRAPLWVQLTPERYARLQEVYNDTAAAAAAAAALKTSTRRKKDAADEEAPPASFPEPARVVYEYTREHYCYVRGPAKLYEFHVDAFAFDKDGGTGRGRQMLPATSSARVL